MITKPGRHSGRKQTTKKWFETGFMIVRIKQFY